VFSQVVVKGNLGTYQHIDEVTNIHK